MQKHRKDQTQSVKKKRLGRDTLFVALGVLTFVHEVVIYRGDERVAIIFASLALMGLPAAAALDQFRRK